MMGRHSGSVSASILSADRPLIGQPAKSSATSLTVTKERLALGALLVGTGILYLWNLSASGWANAFYSAAVQAGAHSWKAFFFGSFDSSNFITVDKTPAFLWVMDISARIFGVNAWSILVPQALEGVAAVAVLYAAVKRVAGFPAGMIAGAVLALTPVAALMFRFNNPDALLTLELTTAAYCMIRAHEDGRSKWLILVGALIGVGFLTKMLQAFVVLPGFAITYFAFGPGGALRRAKQLCLQWLAVIVSCGWWVAIVSFWPASDRPYIGGSQNNTIWNVVFGYNGLGRLSGNESGSVHGPAFGGSIWGPTGWNRLFLADFGGDASWLIPTALLAIVAVLWLRRSEPRADPSRASMLIWASWLIVTAVVFSYAQGIIHPYYTVVLAPAIGALVGLGAVQLWRGREHLVSRLFLAVGIVGTAIWANVLLDRVPDWMPNLPTAILIAAIGAAGALLVLPRLGASLAGAAAIVALVAVLAGPGAYTVATAGQPESGAIPAAGPPQAASLGNGFGGPPRGGFGFRTGGVGFMPPPGGFGGGAFGRGGFGGGRGGGLLDASSPDSTLVKALQKNAARYTWVAATVGANTAAGYQLGSNEPVMAIGGFNGTDPTPTLNQFIGLVKQDKIHYFIGGGRFGAGFGGGFGGFGQTSGGESAGGAIESWVQSHYTATTIGGVTLYNLSL
jgi:4-amino-4-deoxy-L-arabinose transferase-like glycosyltransferase